MAPKTAGNATCRATRPAHDHARERIPAQLIGPEKVCRRRALEAVLHVETAWIVGHDPVGESRACHQEPDHNQAGHTQRVAGHAAQDGRELGTALASHGRPGPGPTTRSRRAPCGMRAEGMICLGLKSAVSGSNSVAATMALARMVPTVRLNLRFTRAPGAGRRGALSVPQCTSRRLPGAPRRAEDARTCAMCRAPFQPLSPGGRRPTMVAARMPDFRAFHRLVRARGSSAALTKSAIAVERTKSAVETTTDPMTMG